MNYRSRSRLLSVAAIAAIAACNVVDTPTQVAAPDAVAVRNTQGGGASSVARIYVYSPDGYKIHWGDPDSGTVATSAHLIGIAYDANNNVIPDVKFTWKTSAHRCINVTQKGIATATNDTTYSRGQMSTVDPVTGEMTVTIYYGAIVSTSIGNVTGAVFFYCIP